MCVQVLCAVAKALLGITAPAGPSARSALLCPCALALLWEEPHLSSGPHGSGISAVGAGGAREAVMPHSFRNLALPTEGAKDTVPSVSATGVHVNFRGFTR